MGHIQILVQSQTVLEIEYPENFRQLLESLNVFQLDFLAVFSVQCYAKFSLLDEYLLLLLAVPVGVLFIFMCGKISSAYSSPRTTEKEFDSETANPVAIPELPITNEEGDMQQTSASSFMTVRDAIFAFLFVMCAAGLIIGVNLL